MVFHENQQYEERHRPIEHSFKKKNKKLKCRTLIETNILGELKYRDEKNNKYPDIDIGQQKEKKRKGYTISPREEKRKNN